MKKSKLCTRPGQSRMKFPNFLFLLVKKCKESWYRLLQLKMCCLHTNQQIITLVLKMTDAKICCFLVPLPMKKSYHEVCKRYPYQLNLLRLNDLGWPWFFQHHHHQHRLWNVFYRSVQQFGRYLLSLSLWNVYDAVSRLYQRSPLKTDNQITR